MSPSKLRPAAVAGLFYPDDPARLRASVDALLSRAMSPAGPRPRALIVPHAGFVYSGAVAAAAYARLTAWRGAIRRVILLGPPHRVPVRDIATSSADGFVTPLGRLAVDRATVERLAVDGRAHPDDDAHVAEHALEVQLPFLQTVLDGCELVPLLVGDVPPERLADVLAPWWFSPDTLVLVSTDLSHFLDYAAAQRQDSATDAAIMALQAGVIGPEQACGCRALNGLLSLGARVGATIERLALCNSADSAGDRSRVVGYASYALR